ncbi:hemerythrin domain-containing protein [Sphingomonas japonica]|uniref:Hemerythrin-like domain-containing protein n=1 Tax=Sphingomonas japonica TaxID=511662 RepID=A0ABX0U140_9SPHN|nr:hemerythrin domain-containing protein [Sphingomonas japonica]NIJ23082.1 hemerythrin-like domain-containing protein [Sphingomonas japonica]
MSTSTTTPPRDDEGKFVSKDDQHSNLGLIAGAATAGVALGMLAMLGRKAAVQAPSMLAGDWADALAAEHKATLKIFDALEATEARNTTKRAILLAQLKHALAKHAIEEENVIYPALREAGKIEQADELNKEHGYVKQYLYELENMPNDSPDYLAKVRKFRADIEEHMTEEETVLFPALRAQLSEAKNKALTSAVNKEGFKVA